MPANFSARAFLWIGVSLLVGSALLQAGLDFLFRMAGSDILQSMLNSWWYSVLDVTRALLVPLGPLMLAAFFVARAIERSSGAPGSPVTDGAIPASAATRGTAVWLFGAAVVLTLFGILVAASLDSWLVALNAQGRTSLALDAVNLVVVPLRTVVLPLGLALLPASALVKKLESRASVATGARPSTD